MVRIVPTSWTGPSSNSVVSRSSVAKLFVADAPSKMASELFEPPPSTCSDSSTRNTRSGAPKRTSEMSRSRLSMTSGASATTRKPCTGPWSAAS